MPPLVLSHRAALASGMAAPRAPLLLPSTTDAARVSTTGTRCACHDARARVCVCAINCAGDDYLGLEQQQLPGAGRKKHAARGGYADKPVKIYG